MAKIIGKNNLRIRKGRGHQPFRVFVASVCGSLSSTKCTGIVLNTFEMDDDVAKAYVERTKAETRLAVIDVVRYGDEDLGRAILEP